MLNSNDLINKVKVYNKFLNPERLDKAFNFAVKAIKIKKELQVTLTQSIQSR
jgi:hypothetical protein